MTSFKSSGCILFPFQSLKHFFLILFILVFVRQLFLYTHPLSPGSESSFGISACSTKVSAASLSDDEDCTTALEDPLSSSSSSKSNANGISSKVNLSSSTKSLIASAAARYLWPAAYANGRFPKFARIRMF